MSSLSGYESIDGNINSISLSNGVTKKSISANHSSQSGGGNSLSKDFQNMTCFSNPNYLCPDAKTIIERKQQKNKFDETVLPPTPSVAQLARDESHQNFAAALNSPAESLITDYQVIISIISLKICIKSPKVMNISGKSLGTNYSHMIVEPITV